MSGEMWLTERLAMLMLGFLRIRTYVDQARDGGWSAGRLEDVLVKGVLRREHELLHRVACSMYKSNGEITHKRCHIHWAHADKRKDKLFKMLDKRLGRHRRELLHRRSQGTLQLVLYEIFYARVLCHTSARYGQSLPPTAAAPPPNQAWRLYGDRASKHNTKLQATQHLRFLNIYLNRPAEIPTTSCTCKLTAMAVRSAFGTTPFTSYQIAGDFSYLVSQKLVDIAVRDLGHGATLGDVVIPWESLLDTLRNNRVFRRLYGGRITLVGLGHLVCEVRQNVYKRDCRDLSVFVKKFGGADRNDAQPQESAKRKAAIALAAYAAKRRRSST